MFHAASRTAEPERPDEPHEPPGASRAPRSDWDSKGRMFCQTRLEMLNNRLRSANEFANAVRRMRTSGEIAARAACEQARRESRLAREVYDEHVRDHRC